MKPARCSRPPAGGFTLIDVVVLIVLLGSVSASLAGLFTRLAEQSAQATVERQALAVAQALLAEVTTMPFTYCDADDARVRTASAAQLGASGCATQVDGLGPEPGETRYAAPRFDHINDYHGFTMPGAGCAGLCDRSGTLLNPAGSPLQGCSASVSVQPQALAGIAALDAQGSAQALRVVVSVDCDGRRTQLEAVRTRHAPNQP